MSEKRPTRMRLLDAAIELMWRQGFNAVSVDAICERARANKGSFYHAFASKDALMTEAINLVWARDAAELREIAALEIDAMARLERHLDWFLDRQRQHLSEHGFVAGHFHAVIDASVPEAARAATANRAAYRAMLRALLIEVLEARGANLAGADALTDMLAYFISGVTSEARLSNSLAPLEVVKPLSLYLVDQAAATAQFQTVFAKAAAD